MGGKEIRPHALFVAKRFRRLTPPPVNGKTVDRYDVCLDDECYAHASVSIVVSDGIGYYLVEEPPLDNLGIKALTEIMNYIYLNLSLEVLKNFSELKKEVFRAAEELGIRDVIDERIEAIWYYMLRETKYSLITIPVEDPFVEDVELGHWRKPVTVVHRLYSDVIVPGGLFTNIVFSSEEEARSLVIRLGAKAGRSVNLARPRLHASLPEGYRVAATLGVVSKGPTFSIRKFPQIPIVVTELIREGVLSPLMAAYFWLLNESRQFYIIVGASGVGKTTLLNALLMLSPPTWKIVVIEDVPEIIVSKEDDASRPRIVRFLSNERVSAFELATDALRYRPDIIVVGEVRGREIEALVRAVASGAGSATTFHASTPDEVMMAMRNLLPQDLFALFISNMGSLAFIAKVFKSREGRFVRRVLGVYELIDGNWCEVFKWIGEHDRHEPEDPEKVVEKSRAMKRAAAFLVMNLEDISKELAMRAKFLEKLSNELNYGTEVEKYQNFVNKIIEFYRRLWSGKK